MPKNRVVDHAVNPLFVNRWSPRAFTGEAIDDATLNQFFEAARWAPSAYNSQPWRFIYAKNGSAYWADFLDFLSEFNQSWAKNASALVLVVSKTTFVPPGKTEPIRTGSHTFDTGAAWGYLALQASHAGWYTHAIGGYDKTKARQVLGIPEDYLPEAIIAIGKQADKSILPEGLQEKEIPSTRQPVSQLVAEGGFSFAE